MAARNNFERHVTRFPDLSTEFTIPQLAADVAAQLLMEVDTSGRGIVGTANSRKIIGVNPFMRTMKTGKNPEGGGDNPKGYPVGIGRQFLLADTGVGVIAGQRLKSYAAGKCGPMLDGSLTGTTIKTTAVGSAFGNQPANDIVQVKSSSAGDTTQIVTLIGTTNAVNTVVVQNVALNGTNAVDSAKADWGKILAVKLSAACAGTITIQKKTGPATIITIAPAGLSAGVNVVAAGVAQNAYNAIPQVVSDGATTKQVGIQGTDSTGAVIYDSVALNGTTAVPFNSAFRTVTEVYTGDVENTRTETVKTSATADSADLCIGKALENSDATTGRFNGILVLG